MNRQENTSRLDYGIWSVQVLHDFASLGLNIFDIECSTLCGFLITILERRSAMVPNLQFRQVDAVHLPDIQVSKTAGSARFKSESNRLEQPRATIAFLCLQGTRLWISTQHTIAANLLTVQDQRMPRRHHLSHFVQLGQHLEREAGARAPSLGAQEGHPVFQRRYNRQALPLVYLLKPLQTSMGLQSIRV